MRFDLYGEGALRRVTFDELCARRDIFARAECSGSEGCYVEVARWNEEARRWEKYAFLKFLGGTLTDEGGEVDVPSSVGARIVAELLNKKSEADEHLGIIHALPSPGDQ